MIFDDNSKTMEKIGILKSKIFDFEFFKVNFPLYKFDVNTFFRFLIGNRRKVWFCVIITSRSAPIVKFANLRNKSSGGTLYLSFATNRLFLCLLVLSNKPTQIRDRWPHTHIAR